MIDSTVKGKKKKSNPVYLKKSEREDEKNVEQLVTSHVNRWRINNDEEIQSHA